MTLQSLAARLKMLREARKLTKYRLAQITGVSETYIYRIERGLIENPRRDTLQKLASGLDISLAELVGDIAPSDTWSIVEQSLKAYIPVYSGIEVGMNPVDFIACTRVQTPPDTVRGYRIDGLCLEPEIRGGDTLIVDSALIPNNGDLLLVSLEGKAMLGHYIEAGGVRLLENSRGQHELTKDVIVHGVVTEYVRKLR